MVIGWATIPNCFMWLSEFGLRWVKQSQTDSFIRRLFRYNVQPFLNLFDPRKLFFFHGASINISRSPVFLKILGNA